MRFGVVLLVLSLLAVPAQAAEPGWRETVRAFAEQHFKQPAWGYSHGMRDYELAKSMAMADHVTLDDDVLFAAAYLHDMAGFKPWEKSKLDHSDVGAEAVGTVLKGTGFPMAKIDAVRAAIRTHMYYRDPAAPEAVYLHDADALDWLGAIGVARIFALVDPNGKAPTSPDALKQIETLEKEVPPRVVSPAGKALIEPRLAEEKLFLDALRIETDDYKAL